MEDWIERYKRGQCNDPSRNHETVPIYSSDVFKGRDHDEVHDTCILRFADRLKAMGIGSPKSKTSKSKGKPR
jgi:hypothetical protein